MDILRGLFGKGVATAHCDPRIEVGSPFREEERFVERAVESRKREFHAGRASARVAMEKLALPPVAIPAAPDRAPVWPRGVVGSISHCSTLCIAAVALEKDGHVSLGVDVEPAEPLPDDLIETICTAGEQDWLGRQPGTHRLLLARVIFSAKESVYKCQYPLTGAMLEFQDVEISLDQGAYRTRFLRDIAGIDKDIAPVGLLKMVDGFILTSSVIMNRPYE